MVYKAMDDIKKLLEKLVNDPVQVQAVLDLVEDLVNVALAAGQESGFELGWMSCLDSYDRNP